MFSPTLGKTLLKRCNLKTLRSKFLSFLLCAYFCEKILNWYQMHFYECWKKNSEKSHIVFEGPLQTHWNFVFFSAKCFFKFFFNIHNKRILYQFKTFFHKNNQVIKRRKLLTARSSNYSVSAKFFPMLVKTPYIGGIINQKTYL